MRHDVTHSLIYQIQRPIRQLFTRQNRGNIQTISLPVALLHCTYARLYKTVHYRKKRLLTMEKLHNESFNNLCVVADWLIIRGLNAIMLCESSEDSYPNSAVARLSTSLQDKYM